MKALRNYPFASCEVTISQGQKVFETVALDFPKSRCLRDRGRRVSGEARVKRLLPNYTIVIWIRALVSNGKPSVEGASS